MKKYYKLIICLSVILIFLIGLGCFLLIPRLDYAYDEKSDSYYVKYAWGYSTSYVVEDYINDKPVTKIGDRAFYHKKNLVSVKFKNKENLTSIGRLSFSGCENLKDIDLSCVLEIGINAFEECYSLESVTLGVLHISFSTFYDCKSLKNVELINTISIGSYAFANTKIESIYLPDSLETIYYNAFDQMDYLKVIYLRKKFTKDDYIMSLDDIISYR